MATQYRSGATFVLASASSSVLIPLPAGMTAGDLIVIAGQVCDADVTFSVPLGWTIEDEGFDAAFLGQNGVIVSGFWNGTDTDLALTASASVEGWYFNQLAFYDDAAGPLTVSGADMDFGISVGTATCPATAGGPTDTVVRTVGLTYINNSGFSAANPAGYTDPSLTAQSNPGGHRGYTASFYDLSADGGTSQAISIGTNYWVGFTISIGVGCFPPENDGGSDAPQITGTVEVGETLTADEGVWSNVDTMTTNGFQWFRVCGTVVEELTGETGTTYVVVEDDIGCNLFVEVTADSGCEPDGVADSDEVGPVPEPPSAPVNVTPPVVTGVPQPGHSLVTTNGTWTGSPSPTFTYQWEILCGTMWEEILGETDDEILVLEAWIGCQIRVVVTGTNTEGSSEAISNAILILANVPAAVEICESPLWRFVITTLDMETLTFLDRLARNRTVTYTLNGSAVATGTVPSDSPEINIPHTDGDPFLAEGNRLLFGFRYEPQGGGIFAWIVRYAGIIMQIEDAAQQDNSDSSYTAYDPWQYLKSRPVRNGPDFDYTLPGLNGSSYTDTRIDVIAGEILRNTIVTDGPVFIDAGTAYGGTPFYGGTIEACPTFEDFNFPQGTSVGDAWDELVSTNQADFILTPIYDPIRRPGYSHELNIYQQAGSIIDAAIFGWDKIPRNLIGISRLLEGTGRANKVKFFAGQGGTAVGGQTIPVQTDSASVAKFGQYWAQQFFPGDGVPEHVEKLAAAQLDIRKNGRQTVVMSPSPDCATALFQQFFLGDRVPVYASDRLRQELEGYQRIYGIPISIADDATETIERMIASKEGVS